MSCLSSILRLHRKSLRLLAKNEGKHIFRLYKQTNQCIIQGVNRMLTLFSKSALIFQFCLRNVGELKYHSWEIEILLSNVLLWCYVKNIHCVIVYHRASASEPSFTPISLSTGSLCLMRLCSSKKLQRKVPPDRDYSSKIHSFKYCGKKVFCMWRDAFWNNFYGSFRSL